MIRNSVIITSKSTVRGTARETAPGIVYTLQGLSNLNRFAKG